MLPFLQATSRPRPDLSSSNKWAKPPDWFNSQRYAKLRNLNLAQWQYEIQRCKWLCESAQPGEWNNRPAIPGFIGAPIVQIVPKGELSLHRLEKPALIVQLDAPDGVIIRKVKEALLLARKSYPIPISKPGRKSANTVFTKRQISSWLSHKLVELCELDNWRAELRSKKERPLPTDADFGRWLFATYSDSSKEVVTARRLLKQAIAGIPALWAQEEGGTLEFVTGN